VVLENRKVTPIATSHQPIAINQNSGVANGNQTIALSKLSETKSQKVLISKTK
jgi:hypothetical protein